ncbi:hypothetical protein AAMO2058_001741100 [Amorphochlora amoebiformis]
MVNWVGFFLAVPLLAVVGNRPHTSSKAFLLYDAKIGEGFNLQKEIFIRAAWLAKSLTDECKTEPCREWSLVLPPWCQLAHWRVSEGTVREWHHFFDIKLLKSGGVDVIEYSEYRRIRGSDSVDLLVHLETFVPDEWKSQTHPIDCAQSRAFKRQFSEEGEGAVGIYSGYCGDIRASLKHCFKTWGETSDFLAPKLTHSFPDVKSILVKHLDSAAGPYDINYYTYRALLLPSRRLRKTAEKFAKKFLRRPYLSAHVRRTDFVKHAHPESTPSLSVVAKALTTISEKYRLRSIFVATDATEEERQELRKQNRRIVFFDQDLGHPGENALVEQWIAVFSNYFVGTQKSRFTLNIQEERDLMGIHVDRTWNHFCKDTSTLCPKPNW